MENEKSRRRSSLRISQLRLQTPFEMVLVVAAIWMQQGDSASYHEDGCAEAAEKQQFSAVV